MTNGPPDLHDRKATLQKLIGLIGEQIAYALWPGPLGIIIMRITHRAADLLGFAHRAVSGTKRVIEDQDPLSA